MYRETYSILRRKEQFWHNGAGGGGDASTDKVIEKDPNDYLQPLAGNRFYQIIAIIAVLGLTIGFAIMATKKTS